MLELEYSRRPELRTMSVVSQRPEPAYRSGRARNDRHSRAAEPSEAASSWCIRSRICSSVRPRYFSSSRAWISPFAQSKRSSVFIDVFVQKVQAFGDRDGEVIHNSFAAVQLGIPCLNALTHEGRAGPVVPGPTARPAATPGSHDFARH